MIPLALSVLFISEACYSVQCSGIINKNTNLLLTLNTPLILTLPKRASHVYLPVVINSSTDDFISFQVHSQYKNVLTSFKKESVYGSEYNSTNAGIMLRDAKPQIKAFVGVDFDSSVQSVLFAVLNEADAPVPGACCLSCNLEIDPNIKVVYDSFKTRISFNRANTYWKYNSEASPCDYPENPVTYSLTYNVYYYYLDENDFSENGLFNGLWKMATPENIKRYGVHLSEITGESSLSVTSETVSAQGVIFNVVVFDGAAGKSAAYVPVVTYACNFTGPPDDCHSKGSTTAMVYYILFALVGVVMCFAGFKLFRGLLFLCGSIFFCLIIYVVMVRCVASISHTEVMVISSVCALVGGGFMLFLYAFQNMIYVCLLNICLVFGMFVSAILFYTPFGYWSFWDTDVRFILGYSCFVLLVAVIFIFYPKVSCYLCSSLAGSYAVILPVSFFVRANMQYIVLTAVFRMTVRDFGDSYLRRPYQKYDYILTSAWTVLFIAGFVVQYRTSKSDHFDVSGKKMREKTWLKFSESVNINKYRKKKKLIYIPPNRERTPLLGETSNYSNVNNSNVSSQSHPSTFSNDNVFEYNPQIHQQPVETQPVYGSIVPSAPTIDNTKVI